MLMVPSIFAFEKTINLIQKNPSDWSVIKDGAKGEIQFARITGAFSDEEPLGSCDVIKGNDTYAICKKIWHDTKVVEKVYTIRAKISKAQPKTDYTLIYYGFGSHNNEFPYATCISSHKTDKKGSATLEKVKVDNLNFLNDGINQRYFIVKSKDVDCKNNKMIAWNPAEYIFETKTV